MFALEIILLSCLAGLISGLTGVGGGIIFTPLFKMICSQGQFSCLAADSVYLSMIAVFVSNAPGLLFSSKMSFLPYDKVKAFIAPMILGLMASQFFIFKMSSFYHDLFLCMLICYVNLIAFYPQYNVSFFGPYKRLAGVLVGLLSGIAGIGGALFFFPIWKEMNLNYRQITAANTAIVITASLSLSLMTLFYRWQPPIDLYVLALVIGCATSVNLLVSSQLKSFEENTIKKLNKAFFLFLLFFYLIRVFQHV